VLTLATFALALCLATQTFTPNCAAFVPKRAIAMRLNVKSMTMTIASVVPSLAVAVSNLVVR
jgi:hypothetical protein